MSVVRGELHRDCHELPKNTAIGIQYNMHTALIAYVLRIKHLAYYQCAQQYKCKMATEYTLLSYAVKKQKTLPPFKKQERLFTACASPKF